MPEERVVAIQSFVFRRADTDTVWDDNPTSPIGGSFYNPTPTNAFWSRIPLPGYKPLFVSMRIFTSDGLYPQEPDWSPPVLFVQHGEQGDKGADGISGSNGTNGVNGTAGNDGTAGQDGEIGDTGISISWAGNATSHPTEPIEGLAYYNTVDKVTYVYWGGFWYIMGKDGIDLTLDLTPPAIIANLSAVGLYSQIVLSWDTPTDPLHAYTEIYRNTVDNRNTAEFIAGSVAHQYTDIPPDKSISVTYYYWVKAVSSSFIQSDWNAVAGVTGSTADDPSYMLELLGGRLGFGQFDLVNGVFPIRTVLALPALPNIQTWPVDSRVFLTSNKLIYKNVANVWTLEGDQAAIRAEFGVGVLTAGAVLAESVGANEIIANTANIKDAVITSAKISSVATDKLTAGSALIGSALIADAAIVNAKIDRASANKLVVVTADIGAAAITTAKIGNAQVDMLRIGANAVTVPTFSQTTTNYTFTFADIISGWATEWFDLHTHTFDSKEQPTIVFLDFSQSSYYAAFGYASSYGDGASLLLRMLVDNVEIWNITLGSQSTVWDGNGYVQIMTYIDPWKIPQLYQITPTTENNTVVKLQVGVYYEEHQNGGSGRVDAPFRFLTLGVKR